MNAEVALLKHRYIQKLNDLYGGEVERLTVWSELVRVAQASELKCVFQRQLEKTRIHIERLDQIFARLGLRPAIFRCRKTEALVEKAQHFQATHTVLISIARRLELDEISGYLLALNCAQILWEHAAADLLEQTLKEEYEADKTLAEFDSPGPRHATEIAGYSTRSP